MLGDDVDVVLGGGLLRAGSAQLDDRIEATIHAAAPDGSADPSTSAYVKLTSSDQ